MNRKKIFVKCVVNARLNSLVKVCAGRSFAVFLLKFFFCLVGSFATVQAKRSELGKYTWVSKCEVL